MKKMILVFFSFLMLSYPGSARASPLDSALQLIVVTTPTWDSVKGQLTRYQKQGEIFTEVGQPIPVVVGNHGMAWGRGRHPQDLEGPQKQEGDGRATAGIFELGRTMGYAPQNIEGSSWPYTISSNNHYCVDDQASEYYNRVVDLKEVGGAPKWKSAEKMRRDDDLYRWLVVVYHNLPQPQGGAGSCIFLHVWRSPEKGTTGCTAMSEENLTEIIKWLKAESHPLLVQLPEGEYQKFKTGWGLP